MLESEDISVYSIRVSRAAERMKTTIVGVGHIPDDEQQGFSWSYFKSSMTS
jgi:hypothetical protein